VTATKHLTILTTRIIHTQEKLTEIIVSSSFTGLWALTSLENDNGRNWYKGKSPGCIQASSSSRPNIDFSEITEMR